MPYRVTWKFGDGASEAQSFDDESVARQEAVKRSSAYAREYGRCETQLVDGTGQLYLDHTDIYYG